MIFDSLNYDNTAEATRHGFTFALSTEHDDSMGTPWDEYDDHGPVSGWRSKDSKAPGELVLYGDGHGRLGTDGARRYYDYAEACRIARRDGWGSLWPYTLQTERQRGGAWIARATARHMPDLVSKPRRDINRAILELYDMRRAQLGTARAYAANAARADYEYLRAYCNDDWHYTGVIVTCSRNGIKLADASLWGIESTDSDHLLEVANSLVDEALEQAREVIAALKG